MGGITKEAGISKSKLKEIKKAKMLMIKLKILYKIVILLAF
jgi:DNA-binding Xre family transcriptional regulator